MEFTEINLLLKPQTKQPQIFNPKITLKVEKIATGKKYI